MAYQTYLPDEGNVMESKDECLDESITRRFIQSAHKHDGNLIEYSMEIAEEIHDGNQIQN